MEIFISYSVIGIFATDKDGNLIDSIIFHDNHSDRFIAASKTALSKDELKFTKGLQNNKKDAKLIFESKKEGFEYQFPNPAGLYIRDNLKKLAKTHANLDRESLNSIISVVNTALTSDAIKNSVKDDNLIIQAVSTIDELTKVSNQMTMRLREWYSLYYPEFSARCSSNETFVKIVATETERESIKSFPFKDTIGADLDKEDLSIIKAYALKIDEINKEATSLENYIKIKINKLLPSTSKLINPLLAARLIAQAGSLKKIASFPSSTIQVIGAEKALFKHLQGHGLSPKHGLIFHETLVNQSQKHIRGKIARHLASALSVSFKVDAYGGEDIGKALRTKFELTVDKIKEAGKKKKNPHRTGGRK